MKRSWILIVVLLSLGAGRSLNAQATDPAAAAHARAMLERDTLPTSKKELQDDLVELRDTLNVIASINLRMNRAQNSGTASIVLAGARQLVRACRASSSEIDRTRKRIADMNTPDPKGSNALSAYRGALDDLQGALHDCQKDDSVLVAAKAFDPKRALTVAGAVDDAINTHDQIRDAMVTLFGFKMPATGYIPRPKPLH